MLSWVFQQSYAIFNRVNLLKARKFNVLRKEYNIISVLLQNNFR